MSEYIEIVEEPTDDPDIMIFQTNLTLAEDAPEAYDSVEAMEVGSPVAQALSVIEDIDAAWLDDDTLTIRRQPDAGWYAIVADVSAVLKDFFL